MPAEIRELATVPDALRFTGERIARIRPRTYRKVISLLGAQASIEEIARTCRVSPSSVRAIERSNAATIGERKNSLTALAYRIASGAGESVENDIASGKIRGSAATVAFGVATDKLLALSGEPTARLAIDIGGSVNVSLLFQQIADNVEKVAQAVTIPAPALPNTPAP